MDLTAHKSVIAVLIIISMTSISIFWKDKYSHLVTIDRHYNQIKENIITDRRYPIETNLATTSVTILAYHSVREIRPEDSLVAREMYITSPALFTTEMQYLKDNNYHIVTMDDLMESLSRASNTPELALPTNSVIITFDDGYKSQHTFALPILQAFGYRAIFFIYTKSVGVYRVSMTWADVMDLKQKGMTIEIGRAHV